METSQKLDPEFKAKWLAELRSGKHKQGRNTMYDTATDGLCCLAVAGLVCGLSKDEMAGVDIITQRLRNDVPEKKLALSKKAADLHYPEMLAAMDSVGKDLAEMNDDGKSFSEIADWIETNL